jgi:hypothetical protein
MPVARLDTGAAYGMLGDSGGPKSTETNVSLGRKQTSDTGRQFHAMSCGGLVAQPTRNVQCT